jgi:hypothetical protein
MTLLCHTDIITPLTDVKTSSTMRTMSTLLITMMGQKIKDM